MNDIGNPELAGVSNTPGKCRDFTLPTLDNVQGKEKVHPSRKLEDLGASPGPIPAALTQWRCINLPKRGTLNSNNKADVSKTGDVKVAFELGYRGHARYRYSVCQACNKERWVRLNDYEQGKGLVCRSCGYPSSNLHQKKQSELRLAGAKRASELGKPVSKNRDPWYYKRVCSCCGGKVWQQTKDFHRVCRECTYKVRQTARGSNHPNWKGGRYNHGDGYIVVSIPEGSPYFPMADSKGYCLEHRLVVAQHIGRCLFDGEVVHHINGDKRDNRIENLELLPDNVSHLPYIQLQKKVSNLEKEVRLLKWHIVELEHGNPVARREDNNTSQTSVETVQEAHPSDGGETVHS